MSYFKRVNKGRWIAYFYQINEILSFEPINVLEIGVVFSLNGFILKYEGIDYKSLDIDPNNNPDIIGSITDIPLENKAFDVVCAFQVLEHLPFENSMKALAEMFRVAKKGVVISLPCVDYNDKDFEYIEVSGHHWEIGYKKYDLNKITTIISEIGDTYFFDLIKTFRCPEFQYHQFFLLKRWT